MSPHILTAHNLQQRSSDAAHSFTQESNFLYLTKINEPNWRLVVVDDEKYLIAPNINDTQRVFEGGLSSDEARSISGIDNILTSSEGEELIKELSGKFDEVYSLGPDPHEKYYDFTLNEAPQKLWNQLRTQFKEVRDCRPQLAKRRAIKTPEEIDAIRRVIDATAASFERIKKSLGSYSHEYQIEAEFSYDFRRSGLDGHAYEPIVASGGNACTLHYGANSQKLPENGLVLMDIGASFGGFNADITRTYAIGVPTKRQVAVHDAVQRAHKAIVSLIKPGVSLKSYQDQVDDIMKEALSGLGLLNKPDDYRKYFPHAISHGLGIDVHESLGGYGEFEPGMVLTVEPGIYIPEEGIGVRIEDDILVTESGNENLSGNLGTGL